MSGELLPRAAHSAPTAQRPPPAPRSGSTYLFNVFRKSPHGFRCYQEALHETVAKCIDEPSRLLGDAASRAHELRHEEMEHPHFYELFEAWPAWREAVDEGEVYGGYFRTEEDDEGVELWRCLMGIDAVRPVFQECRTSGRMAQLKRQLGGYHIYLWRNPRDQWQSYKVNRYFGIINRIILNSPGAPALLVRVAEKTPFSRTQIADVGKAIIQLYPTFLTEEQDYRLFYTIWCLAMIGGVESADLLLSIDDLSSDHCYRLEIPRELERACIGGLDFSGAAIPRNKHLIEETAETCFRVEAEVHEAICREKAFARYSEQIMQLSFKHKSR